MALAKESEETSVEDLEICRTSVNRLMPLCQKSNKADVVFRGYIILVLLEISVLGQDWENCHKILDDPNYEDLPIDVLKRASGKN
jgi:hypothetical protein